MDKEEKKDDEINKTDEINDKEEKKVEEKSEPDLNVEDNENHNNNITIKNSICKNFLSWSTTIIAVFLISSKNPINGFITFFLILFLIYFSHYSSHKKLNVLTALHHYHHTHNNFFSHFIQYLIELNFPILFLPIYYIFGTTFFDPWIVFFSAMFYSTVHNINYGLLRVNNVHSLHHKNVFTNIGPDICDIVFGTKNKQNKDVEITHHYIPNIVLITILILILQKVCDNEKHAEIIFSFVRKCLISTFGILFISSFYVFCVIYKKPILHSEIILKPK
jgi:hypothetical protein